MDELLSQINPENYSKTSSEPHNLNIVIEPDPRPCELKFADDLKPDISTLKLEENYEKVLGGNLCKLNLKHPLTTKDAVKYLMEGILKEKVCRYCLNTSLELSSLDEFITVARNGTIFSVSIKQMIASFHPVKINDDPNFPNKICQSCLDRAITSYLFAQQCDQSERALRDCFEDMYEKVVKLDPIERTKRRGRYKLKPNYNTLQTDHKYVINYAEPMIHINSTVIKLPNEPKINDLECLKCSQVLPDTVSLLNHVKTHPKSQWFHCRLCGKSFPKLFHLKKHFRQFHSTTNTNDDKALKCNDCGVISDNYQQFYQHKEKHKFKTVMKHLISCKMDKLCTICLDKGSHMVEIDEYVNLHGGYPELTGDKSVLSMAAATLPEMNILANHTGTKICQKCYSNILISYLFITKTYLIRNKLERCIIQMIKNLSNIDPQKNLCIEISQNFIMPEIDINVLKSTDIEDNKIEVLEDEFRIESDSQSEGENTDVKNKIEIKTEDIVESKIKDSVKSIANDSLELAKVNTVKRKSKTINGYQKDVSEFLTFKKKKPIRIKYTCPICSKHFVSGYFLKHHILKHGYKKVFCESCNAKFNSLFGLFEHNKLIHSRMKINDDNWTCNICERIFKNRAKFLVHRKQHSHRNCHLCDKVYRSQYYFNNHMQRHLKKLRYIKEKYKQTCGFCEQECSNENELSLHVNKVHLRIKPYVCDMCDQQFYTENNLRCHKKVHILYSREKCSFCNKILSSRAKFVVHLRKHIGVKPFTCQICYDAFFSEMKLKKHLSVHLGNFR